MEFGMRTVECGMMVFLGMTKDECGMSNGGILSILWNDEGMRNVE